MPMGVHICGVGMAVPGHNGVPGRIVSNAKLAQELLERGTQEADARDLRGSERETHLRQFTTNDEWIVGRTGIRERCFASPEIATSNLAILAGIDAIASSQLSPEAIHRLDLATVTPDHLASPPTVALVAYGLKLGLATPEGLGIIFGTDTSAACSSFMAALQNAYAAIAGEIVRNALVIGADVMSRIVNITDRGFAVILGDGAGALVLSACDAHDSTFFRNSFMFGMDGRFANRIIVKAGGSRQPTTAEAIAANDHRLSMDGRSVFKEVVSLVYSETHPRSSIIGRSLDRASLRLDAIDIFFFHQANLRMIAPIEAALRRSGFRGLVYNNVERFGNTTSASIPLLIAEAQKKKVLKRGMRFMAVTFGGGYTWGTAIGQWKMEDLF